MPMLGGRPSKLSKDLGNIRAQLKSGMTRGQNPRDLEPDQISALEKQREALEAEMKTMAKERMVARINAHMSAETDRVISAVGGAGSSVGKRQSWPANAIETVAEKPCAVRQRKCGEQGPTQLLSSGCPPPPVNKPAAAAGQQQHLHRREGCSPVEQRPAKTPKLEPSSTSRWNSGSRWQRLEAELRRAEQETQQRASREARCESCVLPASVVSAPEIAGEAERSQQLAAPEARGESCVSAASVQSRTARAPSRQLHGGLNIAGWTVAAVFSVTLPEHVA